MQRFCCSGLLSEVRERVILGRICERKSLVDWNSNNTAESQFIFLEAVHGIDQPLLRTLPLDLRPDCVDFWRDFVLELVGGLLVEFSS